MSKSDQAHSPLPLLTDSRGPRAPSPPHCTSPLPLYTHISSPYPNPSPCTSFLSLHPNPTPPVTGSLYHLLLPPGGLRLLPDQALKLVTPASCMPRPRQRSGLRMWKPLIQSPHLPGAHCQG